MSQPPILPTDPQELLNLYQIARNIILRADLDAYDREVLRKILAALDEVVCQKWTP